MKISDEGSTSKKSEIVVESVCREKLALWGPFFLINAMTRGELIIRFDKVSFEHRAVMPILHEADFSIRRGMKITLMGQNGAGKSTIFQLITGKLKPESGQIHREPGITIATAHQVMPRDALLLSVREFFAACFSEASFAKASEGRGKIYDIDPRIDAVLEVVNLTAPKDRLIKSFSGGQQARLLLASALIQDPDLLLLDEPTNNLDEEGIRHLAQFIKNYEKTVVVISHDADFLNSFTEGVLYLNVINRTVEWFRGNYSDVVREISLQLEKDLRRNAQLEKTIQEKKEQANKFAKKGGQMRLVATRMREKAAELEEATVEVRREDKTIRRFTIPCQLDLMGDIVSISSVTTMKRHKPVSHPVKIILKKKQHLLLSGPNGIGKTTLLESIANGTAKGASIQPGVRVGYYRQDFSTLNFEDTVRDSLMNVMDEKIEEHMRSVASGFLITADVIKARIGHLSEGQKGLVALARLVLQKPGLLILDEPTNHMNFRHLPVIAAALDAYVGAMILVSHVPDFVAKIRIDEVLDLKKYAQ